MTIVLTPALDEFPAEAFAGITRDKIDDIRKFFVETSLTNNLTSTVAVGYDPSGVRYEEVEFKVEARFRRDNQFWVSGGGFAVNVDALIDGIVAKLSS